MNLTDKKLLRHEKLSRLLEIKHKLTAEQKRRISNILTEFAGNLGGTTDISNADNPLVNENEFTGTGNSMSTEPNTITKTFETEADFDSYIRQRRGIQITSKELQSIQHYRKASPTKVTPFYIQYETSDDFGNNTTTIIKKLKEGGGFCWTAFAKYESPEQNDSSEDNEEVSELDEQTPVPQAGNMTNNPPSNPARGTNQNVPQQPPNVPAQDNEEDEKENEKEMDVDALDKIRIIKSIIFNNETDGANILSDFLKSLDI